jgi:hypothetical protein
MQKRGRAILPCPYGYIELESFRELEGMVLRDFSKLLCPVTRLCP